MIKSNAHDVAIGSHSSNIFDGHLPPRKKRKIKSLLHTSFSVPLGVRTVADIKSFLCGSSQLRSEDFYLIQRGSALNDAVEVGNGEQGEDSSPPSSFPPSLSPSPSFWEHSTFAVCKSTCDRTVEVRIKCVSAMDKKRKKTPIASRNSEGGDCSSASSSSPSSTCGISGDIVSVPLNMKVFQFKKRLYAQRITSLRPEAQRIVVGGKLLTDSNLLGDYFILSAASAAAAASTSVTSKGQNQASSSMGPFVAYVSGTINVKHDVQVKLQLPNNSRSKPQPQQELSFSFEISQPVSKIHDLLYKSFRCTMPDNVNDFYFKLIKRREGGDGGKTARSSSDAAVRLENGKSLLDHGVTPTDANGQPTVVRLELWKVEEHEVDLQQQQQLLHSMLLPQLLQQAPFCISSPAVATATATTNCVPPNKTLLPLSSVAVVPFNATSYVATSAGISSSADPAATAPPTCSSSSSKNTIDSVATSSKTRRKSKSSSDGLFSSMRKGFLSSSSSSARKKKSKEEAKSTSTSNDGEQERMSRCFSDQSPAIDIVLNNKPAVISNRNISCGSSSSSDRSSDKAIWTPSELAAAETIIVPRTMERDGRSSARLTPIKSVGGSTRENSSGSPDTVVN